ncbi:ammonium transporter [Luteolibacter sp. AS25]|uniref:ammonium transporter n=1 Tax=Luteolibacter sp. AS25 TaxID=3135776 RepID=UPI00398AF192
MSSKISAFLLLLILALPAATAQEPNPPLQGIEQSLQRIETGVNELLFQEKPADSSTTEAPAEPPATASVDADLRTDTDGMFVILCASLVFFMQAGFCLLELGFVRAKNCLNVVMKNVADFCVAMISFLLLGFSLMFGSSLGGFIGGDVAWLSSFSEDSRIWTFWLFQAVFVATAATIASGAMAERTKFVGYLIYSVMISALIYPILGHWAWGSFAGGLEEGFGGDAGWLEKLGFVDFAGSTVVHGVGGACALAGIMVLGARKGRFTSDGTPRLIAGHNIPLAALGTLILTFGWFGFNCGSNLAVGASLGRIGVNTMVAASTGGLFATLAFWFRDGRPNPSRMLNGVLGGLVAVTACCHMVTPVSALIIGAMAGIISSIGEDMLIRLKLDDVVGAIPVHLFNGIWGTLCVAIFNQDGFSISNLGVQALGTFSICGAAFGISYLGFLAIKATVGLRATEEEEEDGLDFSEHASNAYPDFTTE